MTYDTVVAFRITKYKPIPLINEDLYHIKNRYRQSHCIDKQLSNLNIYHGNLNQNNRKQRSCSTATLPSIRLFGRTGKNTILKVSQSRQLCSNQSERLPIITDRE